MKKLTNEEFIERATNAHGNEMVLQNQTIISY